MRVYVLIVLWCVFPDSFSKAQELKVDVEFPGDDFLQIYSPDVQHCQLACTQHPSCLFLLRTDHREKDFFNGSRSVVAQTGVTSGFKLVHQDNKTDTCLSSTYQGIDFTGSDYVQLTLNTSDDCQKQCTSDPDCAFFSFTTKTFPDAESRNKCFLKFCWTVPTPSVLIKTPGLVSGFSDASYKTKEDCKEEIFANVNYRGNGIEKIPAASPQHCQFLCNKHPRCTHFTYTTSNYSTDPEINMHCYLKHSQNVSQLVQEEMFSGFPTRNCTPSNVWATARYEGLHFLGHDYRDFKTDSSELCRETCTKDPNCHFYTYALPYYHDENIRYKCFLKYRWTVPTPTEFIEIPGLVSGFSDSLYKTKEYCKEEFIENIHYRGNDIYNVPAASPQHCQFLCNTHPRCTHFTYTTSNYSTDPEINMHCFLKYIQDVSQLEPDREEELFSGFPTRNCTPSKVWATARYERLSFFGHDYRDFKTDSSEICRETCTKDPNCHFYTYVPPSNRDKSVRRGCYLKHVMALPIPEKVKHSHGVISGFSLRNCSESTAHPA
ncbi:coagulation factor XI-like isoform X2 [Hemibagrus wyckioides]|uniref:coagulation factor XI-like isoform X2 n=1 Tax=Hemibagrus wyckioides TaxID=337641 RepID=UPI00266D356A|nr:coagulation factor XI-like isoform X2 [Hemibagrus wyckioides]